MTSSNFTPFLKDGAANFSTQVKTHHKMISAVVPTVLTALDGTDSSPGQPFVIGDYGTADGGTSYEMMTKCIDLLRKKYGKALPIQLIYEDQPINNFSPVFMRVHGMLPDVEGLVTRFPGVSVMACGTSFYSQCLPDNSIDFIFSATSIHWLSKSPDVLSASLFPMQDTGHAHEVYRKQAKEDWVTFLLHRSKELRPGGCLVVANPSADFDGRGKTTVYDIHSHMSDVWKTLCEDGIITQAEFERTAFEMYLRSREELVEPFFQPQSPVSNCGLFLESIESQLITCPFRKWWISIQREGKSDYVQSRHFAETLVAERRTWQESSLLRGLGKHRTPEEKQAIVDIFRERYRDLVSNNPLQNVCDFVQHTIVVRKVNN